MTKPHLEHQDHVEILKALDCSQAVAGLDKDVSLLRLQIGEMKSDKEKANRTLMWVCGMAFSIIMAVAGSLISSSATIQVLEEKVKEQKDEINKLNQYIADVHQALVNDIDSHKH